jgi:hypothetical protein
MNYIKCLCNYALSIYIYLYTKHTHTHTPKMAMLADFETETETPRFVLKFWCSCHGRGQLQACVMASLHPGGWCVQTLGCGSAENRDADHARCHEDSGFEATAHWVWVVCASCIVWAPFQHGNKGDLRPDLQTHDGSRTWQSIQECMAIAIMGVLCV